MNEAVEERAGRQHHGAAGNALAGLGQHGRHAAARIEFQIGGFAAGDIQIGLIGEDRLHRLAIELAIGLGAGAAHRRALRFVEHPELNPGAVDRAGHHAVQRVDLADQMPLAQAADRRVAAHLADLGGVERQQQRLGPGARRSGCGFAAGMTAADDHNVVTRGRKG